MGVAQESATLAQIKQFALRKLGQYMAMKKQLNMLINQNATANQSQIKRLEQEIATHTNFQSYKDSKKELVLGITRYTELLGSLETQRQELEEKKAEIEKAIVLLGGKYDQVIKQYPDAETIETELMLADIESIEKRLQNITRKVRGGDKDAVQQERLMRAALEALEAGRPARTVEVDAEDAKAWRMLQLLTTKPVLYVCNVGEAEAAEGNALSQEVAEMAVAQGNAHVVISAQIEEEISQLEPEEAAMFLEEMGLKEAGLDRLIRAGYDLLRLETYFTVGPKEARAWTIPTGTTAPKAAGVIHGDFEKGFIRAETIAYDDFVSLGGEAAAKEAGKMRAEGKSYTVKDGDVLHFLFNT
ncbi:MAG: DUF933 domain-containing protein [bacterium]